MLRSLRQTCHKLFCPVSAGIAICYLMSQTGKNVDFVSFGIKNVIDHKKNNVFRKGVFFMFPHTPKMYLIR